MGSVGSRPRRFLCLASSVCWSLQCLISTLTQGGGGGHFLFKAHLFSCAVGREGRCKQITLACARSVSATLHLPLLAGHTAQALGCSPGNCPRPALGCMHLPGLSHAGSGTQVVLSGADLVGPAFCALPRSEQLRCLASAVAATHRLSRPCCPVFWVYHRRRFSGGW